MNGVLPNGVGVAAEDELSAGAVARRLGVAVTTLRTWHQRYGLGPSAHRPGRHRRYSRADLARLETMLRLTTAGVPPHEAAGLALAGIAPDGGHRDGGGLTIPVGRGQAAARGLARAALRMDVSAVTRIIANAIGERGVIGAWEQVMAPVLIGVGRRHAASGRLVEVEHALSACVSACLARSPRPPATTPVRVLLACANEEQHTLALEALAAALAGAGVASRMLGARVPPDALRAAIRRTGPVVVAIWSQAGASAGAARLGDLVDLPARTGVLLALGPGWAELPGGLASLPDGVVTARTLAEAVALIAPVAGGNR